jgi:hypothetical protein
VIPLNEASKILLNLSGFTGEGILKRSIAAWIHSIIGLVKPNSFFSILQSFGAKGFGIFGKYWIIIVVVAGVVSVTVDLIKRHPRSKL